MFNTMIVFSGGYEFTVINTFVTDIKNSYVIMYLINIRENVKNMNITIPYVGEIRQKFNI
jgi:hypothetical protein